MQNYCSLYLLEEIHDPPSRLVTFIRPHPNCLSPGNNKISFITRFYPGPPINNTNTPVKSVNQKLYIHFELEISKRMRFSTVFLLIGMIGANITTQGKPETTKQTMMESGIHGPPSVRDFQNFFGPGPVLDF